jgi:serine protease AprX
MRVRFLAVVLILRGAVAAPVAPASSRDLDGAGAPVARSPGNASLEKKCSSPLLELLGSVSPSDAVTVWIFFSDRGPAETAAMPAPQTCMSERAVSRRRLRAASLVDSHDLPVYEGYIDSLRAHLVRLRHESRYFNAVSAEVEARELPAVCSSGFVRCVDRVAAWRRPAPPDVLPEEPVRAAAQPAACAPNPYGESYYQLNQAGVIDLLEQGYHGAGSASGGSPILIGILDTGFKLEHDAFQDVHVTAQWDFIQGDSVTSNEPGDSPSQDVHGTTVLGVIAGHAAGSLIGPAWGASFLLAKTEIFDREIPVEEDIWVAGIEWADRLGAEVVTSSLGYVWPDSSRLVLDGDTYRCTIAADIAVSHGIVVVNSSGNRGEAGLVAPADGDSVLTIGAVNRYGALASFSSRGPTADGRIKPDFVAMGVEAHSVSYSGISEYAKYNGTSYAAPLVAGLCALLLEIHSDWNPMQVREALRATSSRSGRPDNAQGYGIPDAAVASRYPESFSVPGAFPNPFSIQTKMQFSSTRAGRVSARVYDCRGSLIRILADGEPMETKWTLSWDGTNDEGAKVASGVYFVHIASTTFDKTIKVVHIR